MGRLAAVRRNPGRALAALAALLVAGVAAVGSGAAFTTETVNPDNTFSSGILSISADGQGAVLTAEGLVPGDSATGTVRIANGGSVDGSSWKLAQSVTSSQPGTDPSDATSHGDLADKLQLEIDDQGTGDQVYSGPISALTSADLTPIAHGTSHTYGFTVTFPSGGTDDNAFEGATLTTSYRWTASAGS